MDVGSTFLGLWEKWGLLGIALALAMALWGVWHRHNKRIFRAPDNESAADRNLRENDLKARCTWIENRYFESVYLNLLGQMLGWLAERLAKDSAVLHQSERKTNWTGRLFGIQPFTEGSYLLCFRLALTYPFLSFFSIWLVGGPGEFAGSALLAEAATSGERFLTLAGLLIPAWGVWGLIDGKNRRQRIYFLVVLLVGAPWAGVAAFAISGFGGGVGVLLIMIVTFSAVASTGFSISAFALFFVLVFGSTRVEVVGLAASLVGGLAIATAFLYEELFSPKAKAIYWVGFSLFFLTASIVLSAWATPLASDPEVLLIGVFLVVLPLVNAALDWMSLGFTRGLLYAIHRGNHTGALALAWAVLDILLALLFLFAIGALSVLLLAGINAATFAWGEMTLMDLGLLFDGLSLQPTALDYGWIHFMMLTTLIPTFFHFTLAGAAAMLVIPNPVRHFILANWDRRGDARTAGLWYVSVVPALGLLAPALLLWGLYALLNAHGGMIGGLLLAWARGLAAMVDPCVAGTAI